MRLWKLTHLWWWHNRWLAFLYACGVITRVEQFTRMWNALNLTDKERADLISQLRGNI